MNKFNFEPVGWLGTENCQPKFISSAPCQIEEEIYGPFKPLHTDDQLAEAYDAGKRDALAELLILGRTDSHGNVVWFGKNPHAFPQCTEFYASAPKGEE